MYATCYNKLTLYCSVLYSPARRGQHIFQSYTSVPSVFLRYLQKLRATNSRTKNLDATLTQVPPISYTYKHIFIYSSI